MQIELLEKMRGLAEQASSSAGCLLYDLEFSSGTNGRVLRVYIDRSEGQVSVDDCANVSRALNLVLDTDEEMIPGGAYDLEVSSPGVERQLNQAWHYAKAIGRPVRVKTAQPTDGGLEGVSKQTLLDGVLQNFENETLTIRKDDKDWLVPMTQVSKAQLRLEMAQNHPKGKKKR